jgi:hypothetical protein
MIMGSSMGIRHKSNAGKQPRPARCDSNLPEAACLSLGVPRPDSRILFVVVLLVIPGGQLIVYPILWGLMPSR